MRALVTGGSGFLGHHLVQALMENTDWDVTILDRASNKFGLRRLEEIKILDSKRLSLIRSDFTSSDFMSMMTGANNFDFIYHLGAKISVNDSRVMPDAYIQANVVGTKNILDFAIRQNHLTSFIYISTNEIFGPGDKGKGFSEWAPYNSHSTYAATKAAGEELALAYSAQFSLPVLIVHTMNVFGEREPPEKFIPQIIRSVLAQRDVPIYFQKNLGIGGRTYLDVRSFSNALLFLSNGILNGSLKLQREKINVAGDEFLTNDQLAHKIALLMEKPIRTTLMEYSIEHPGHILNTKLDISKLRGLGWIPESSLDDGLKRVVAWWTKNPNWPFE